MKHLKYILGFLFVSSIAFSAVDRLIETNKLRFNEASPGTNKIIIQPPTLGLDYTMTLPTSAGTSNAVLGTNGSGILSWVPSSGGGGGSGTVTGPASSISGAIAYFGDTSGTVIAQYTSVPIGRGGTSNIIVAAAGGVGYGTASGISLSLPGASGTFLKSSGTTAPNFAAITLSGDVTGILGLANGGTNANITASHGGVAFSTASAISLTAVSVSGQVLIGQGSAAPVWQSQTYTQTQGTRQIAITISAGQQIIPAAAYDSAIFVSGSGGAVTVTATTPISTTSMIAGQKLTLCGTSDTNTVTYSSGNNLRLSQSPITLRKDGCLQLMYAGSDGTNAAWIDMSNTAQFRATVTPGTIDTAAGTWATLTWSSADIDNVTCFNGTDTCTIRIPGVYSICGLVTGANAIAGYIFLGYTINGGSEFLMGIGLATASTAGGASGCAIAQLALGDVIRFRGLTESASTDISLRRAYIYRLPGQ